MTDDLVQRIRVEADMASRAGQSAALHKIADDLAARGDAAEQVAALGVGDGEVEWGVRWQGKVYPMSEADALAQVRVRPSTRSLVRRTVGPWVEVTDKGGEGA